MSSFHAAFSLGGAAGAVLGGWLGAKGRLWVSWVPLCSRRCSSPSRFRSSCVRARLSRRGICRAQPPPPAACGALFRVDGDGRLGRRLERNLSRPLGRGRRRDRRRLRGLFASDDHRQDCRRRNRRRGGTARDSCPWRSHCRSGARDQRRMAGACRRRRRLRTGRRGPRQCRACALQRRRADRIIAGGWRRFGRDLRAMRACSSGRSSSAPSLPASVCARRSSCWRAWRCLRPVRFVESGRLRAGYPPASS